LQFKFLLKQNYKMSQKFRALTKDEIVQLKSQGCRSCSWDTIKVADKFKAGTVFSTKFSGNIKLGVFDKLITFLVELTNLRE